MLNKFLNGKIYVNAHSPILNAIKAITGMSTYDLAPSKTIAAIIPLLGFGGIVAAKLEENGYVKFANGFTIQWGFNTLTELTPQQEVTFNIKLPIYAGTNIPIAICNTGGISGWAQASVSVTGTTAHVWNTGSQPGNLKISSGLKLYWLFISF